MAVGRVIRGLFGPYERQITEAYRSIYLNVDDYVAGLRAWVPSARTILEVGCGEGAVTERLAAAYPDARITAIDVTAHAGRLYRGPTDRVRFLTSTIEDFAAAQNGKYDLVVLADVLHHVPPELRRSLLDTVRSVIAPGGTLAFKDWERTFTPIHWLGYLSDRWLTGDRIRYMSGAEMRARIAESFGQAALVAERRVKPWRNNLSMLIRP